MKVGDYVRTKYGVIAKITDILENCSIDCDRDIYYENGLKDNMPMMEIPYNIKDEYIIKSSPNIIDLIQEGDFINGDQISKVEVSDIDGIKRAFNCEYESACYTNEMIKSVITKEQIEQISYKVGK